VDGDLGLLVTQGQEGEKEHGRAITLPLEMVDMGALVTVKLRNHVQAP